MDEYDRAQLNRIEAGIRSLVDRDDPYMSLEEARKALKFESSSGACSFLRKRKIKAVRKGVYRRLDVMGLLPGRK